MVDSFPLSTLRSGERGSVCHVFGKPEQVQRLEELGIRAGETIEVVRPGSPCIVRLGGKKLCFREADLLRVLVRAEEPA